MTKPQKPNPFAKWDSLKKVRDADTALVDFLTMARKKSKPDEENPEISAANPRTPAGKPIRMYFRLNEPDGDHDHCLFKANEDIHGRKFSGTRRPQDFARERGERIDFIPEVLANPDAVYETISNSSNLVYACRTGIDEYYLVLIHQRETGHPRFGLITAYPVTVAEWGMKTKKLRLLRPKKSK